MIVNPIVDGYTKIQNPWKCPEKRKKTQPSENQKNNNNREILTQWFPVLTFSLSDEAICSSALPSIKAAACVNLKSHESV